MNREERLVQDGYEPDQEVVEFYSSRDVDGQYSNFGRQEVWLPHPFTGRLTLHRTGEHRYQAMKACNEETYDYVNAASRPGEAKDRGREISLRPGWGDDYGDLCWYVMYELIEVKVIQHEWIRGLLVETGDRPIWEDSPTDDIWGIRFQQSYTGKNLLGRCWMDVRDLLVRFA